MARIQFACVAALVLFTSLATATCDVPSKVVTVNGKEYQVDQVITRNISIIGGGAAGTYAAIGLKDLGHEIIVIEKADRLGGHVETYVDPKNKTNTIDYGVLAFHKFPVVYDYFKRLNVQIANYSLVESLGSGVTQYVDFSTGKINSTYSLSAYGNYVAALGIWAAELAKYPYLDQGYDLPDPVPEDLYLPFSEYVTKYKLEAGVNIIWIYAQGIGNLMELPALYALKYFSQSVLADITGGSVTTAAHNNQLLYDSAAKILGTSVLYNSTIHAVERKDGAVSIIVKTEKGITLIKSKKLLVTIAPTVSNLQSFVLNTEENKLFEQFSSSKYFAGLIKNSGKPSGITAWNGYGPGEPLSIPKPPTLYIINKSSDPKLDFAYYIGDDTTSHDTIKKNIITSIEKIPGRQTKETPEFVSWALHQPFELWVPGEAIKNGFYRDLYALQGKQDTWWAGATFHAHDSSLIWRFTKDLLPRIVA